MALSATNKINYICSAINKNKYDVEIISPSWTNNTKKFYKGGFEKIEEGITIKTFATFGAKNRFQRILKYTFSLFQLVFFLLLNSKKGEKVIVYHSLTLSLPIRIFKLIKGIKLILEVEEIYQDVLIQSKYSFKSEGKIFNVADSFIFQQNC